METNDWLVSVRNKVVHKYMGYKHPPQEIHDPQKTYCLAVPGGLLFVRRKGHCCWSGNSHFFYKAFNMPLWSKYRFKTADNPLVKKEWLEQQREMLGERRFKQEYLAEFVDDEETYFPMKILRPCIHVCEGDSCSFCAAKGGVLKGELYAGYDPGGMTDPAALVVVEKVPGRAATQNEDESVFNPAFRVLFTRTFYEAETAHAESDTEGGQKAREDVYTKFNVEIADLHKTAHFRKLIVDSTGIGSPIVSHCKELGLPVEGLNLHRRNQEEIFSNLKILFEQRKVELPDSMELLTSLNCIVSERNRIGGYSFSHPHGTHDDLAYALALAVWRAGKGGGTVIANFGPKVQSYDYRRW